MASIDDANLEELFFGNAIANAPIVDTNLEDLFLGNAIANAPIVDTDLEDLFFGGEASAHDWLFQDHLGDLIEQQNHSRIIPDGVAHMSSAYGQLLNVQRWKNQKSTLAERFDNLSAAWNMLPRRFGDQVARSDAQPTSQWVHGNTTAMPSCVKAAFSELGKGAHHLAGSVSFDWASRTQRLANDRCIMRKAVC
jgi:hypothetical protein